MTQAMMFRWLALGMLAWIAGCATTPLPQAPLLRLAPASLGASLALQQRLTVSMRGTTQTVDALLEVDQATVRLAVLSPGQTALRLEWDGTELTESRAVWWPAAISGERILSDLQLMLWPVAAIRAALPSGWLLEQQPDGRELRAPDGRVVARVAFLSPAQSELSHLRDGYRIRVDSVAQGVAP